MKRLTSTLTGVIPVLWSHEGSAVTLRIEGH